MLLLGFSKFSTCIVSSQWFHFFSKDETSAIENTLKGDENATLFV
jgi:hypothetical protein